MFEFQMLNVQQILIDLGGLNDYFLTKLQSWWCQILANPLFYNYDLVRDVFHNVRFMHKHLNKEHHHK